jgi:serine/threonine protein kinase
MDYSGQRIDHYQVIEKLGLGGMATVYKAYDTRLERDVAIKLVRKDSIPAEQHERVLKRFEREAKSLAKFLHPNIVPVYDYGEYQGAPYLVMAYLPGGTLKDRIGKPVPLEKAIDWVLPVANALSYAHKEGVVHRDVKPSNILITREGGVMLSDFGIAQILLQETTQLTVTGMGVGTPEYMAPEQWQGRSDEASDQYALGVVLYELLTGVKPYTADTPLAVALKVMSEPLQRPSALVSGISENVEKVLYKALARDPQDRYETMVGFRKALDRLTQKNNTAVDEVESIPIARLNQHKATLTGDSSKVTSSSGYESDTNKELSKQSAIEDHSEVRIHGRPSPQVATPESAGETVDRLDLTPVEGIHRNLENRETVMGQKKEPSPKHKPNRALSWGTLGVVSVMVVLCVLLIALIRREPETEPINYTQSEATEVINSQLTQQAQIDATAKVESTQNAQAQATATAASAFSEFKDFIDVSNLVYEENFGKMEHTEENYITTYWTDTLLQDFALEVTFQNPYASTFNDFDYGISFAGDEEYFFYISSFGRWAFVHYDGGFNFLESGDVVLNTGQAEKNKFQLAVVEQKGYLFINDRFVTALDLSMIDYEGYISLQTGYVSGHQMEGYATGFENLRIYGIDNRVSEVTLSVEPTTTQSPTKTPQVSSEGVIKINTHGIEWEGWDHYRYNVFFNNSTEWRSDKYFLTVEFVGEYLGGSFCDFYYPEAVECQFRNYEGEEYVYCDTDFWITFKWPEIPCLYQMTLLNAYEDSVYSYHYDYTFTRQY